MPNHRKCWGNYQSSVWGQGSGHQTPGGRQTPQLIPYITPRWTKKFFHVGAGALVSPERQLANGQPPQQVPLIYFQKVPSNLHSWKNNSVTWFLLIKINSALLRHYKMSLSFGILSIGEAPDHSVHTGASLTGTRQACLISFKAPITICGFHRNVSAARLVSDAYSSIASVQNRARLIISIHSLLMKRRGKKRVRRRKGNCVSEHIFSILYLQLSWAHARFLHADSLALCLHSTLRRGIFFPWMISIQCWEMEEKAVPSLVLSSKVHDF